MQWYSISEFQGAYITHILGNTPILGSLLLSLFLFHRSSEHFEVSKDHVQYWKEDGHYVERIEKEDDVVHVIDVHENDTEVEYRLSEEAEDI